MKRCNSRAAMSCPVYSQYFNHEWGVPSYDDQHLFEMMVLGCFQCGLSWLMILKKREAFKEAFDNFQIWKVAQYDYQKVEELLSNKSIVRNEGKIRAAIANAKAFINVQIEFGSFCSYIWTFTGWETISNKNKDNPSGNALAKMVSKDLKRRGFKYMGTVTTYSYLEAIGMIHNHTNDSAANQHMSD